MKQLLEYINRASVDFLLEEIDANINYNFVNESIQSSILRDLIKQITETIKNQKENDSWRTSPTFKQLFARDYIAWDKITDNDFEISKHLSANDEDKKALKEREVFEKKIKALIKGNGNALALLRNPKTNTFTHYIDAYGDMRDIKDGYILGGRNGITQYERMSYVKDSDIYYLPLANFSTTEKRQSRRESQDGMINFDKESLSNIARKNVDRYKQIIAKNKLVKRAQNDTIGEDVEEVVNKVMEIILKINKDIVKYADLVYDASKLNKMLYDQVHHHNGKTSGSNGLLVLFAGYMSDKKNGLGNTQYADMYEEDVEKNKRKIEDLIEKIYEAIEKLESKM